ncbi:MAG TPA: CdaR family protein [Terriglobales bacterium]|nr:CdaR family protein [Terriglobales bacterium]
MVNFFRRYIAHNFGLKLLSLAMAVGLWWAVAHDTPAELELTVPVEFQHVAADLEINSDTIPQARVRLRGPLRLIQRIRPTDVHAEIDLGNARPGERTYDFSAQQVHVPDDVEVVQVVPTQFRLSFDTRRIRKVAVHPRVIGTFAPGLKIARVTVDPDQITISGPAQRVDAIDAAITDPVDATGLVSSGSFTTHAYVSDPMVQVLHPGPVKVTVYMEKSAGQAGGT